MCLRIYGLNRNLRFGLFPRQASYFLTSLREMKMLYLLFRKSVPAVPPDGWLEK